MLEQRKKQKQMKAAKARKITVAAAADTDRPQRVQLTLRSRQPVRWFIAVHENGFAVDNDLATAIRAAQESVAFDEKPTQMAIYVAEQEVAPTGFVQWANGVRPRLVGLTNTHQGWVSRA